MADIGWILIALVVGLIVGGGIVWIYARRGDNDHSVETLKRENERFREEVNEHFVQTAELINRMTDSYKAVFDHLSDGAGRLVDAETVRDRMPQVSDREVRLKHIGAPKDKV